MTSTNDLKKLGRSMSVREAIASPELLRHLKKGFGNRGRRGPTIKHPSPHRPGRQHGSNERSVENQRNGQDLRSPSKSFRLNDSLLLLRRVISEGGPNDRTEHFHAARCVPSKTGEVEFSSHGLRIKLRFAMVSLKTPQRLKTIPLLKESLIPRTSELKAVRSSRKGAWKMSVSAANFLAGPPRITASRLVTKGLLGQVRGGS